MQNDNKIIPKTTVSKTAIQVAMEAATDAILLASPSQVARAAKAWQRAGVIGLDTEFVRERTYFANIGLIQISDGRTVWLVDPTIEGCLEPVAKLLANKGIIKLLHSPSEDLEVLLYACGALPEPMVDTQLACALLGQPLQLAYHAAAKWLLDVEVDKEQTRSNWLQRPLQPAQLHYAALDVCLLPEMWRLLENELSDSNRLQWLQDDCANQLAKARMPPDASTAWTRFKNPAGLSGRELAVLKALAQWRDDEARARNLPRGFVIKDPLLLEIVRLKPETQQELDTLTNIHPRARARHGSVITGLVREAMQNDQEPESINPLSPPERALLSSIKDKIGKKAGDLGVEPAVLASRKELESLLRTPYTDWPQKFLGWRHEIIGPDIKALVA